MHNHVFQKRQAWFLKIRIYIYICSESKEREKTKQKAKRKSVKVMGWHIKALIWEMTFEWIPATSTKELFPFPLALSLTFPSLLS